MDFESKASGSASGPPTKQRRENLKKRLFRKCDRDGDGVLSRAEMRELAGLVGFDGTDDEWGEEYQKLCDEQGIPPEHGIPQITVMVMLDDDSDNGCYCTDKELQELLADDHVGGAGRAQNSSGLEPSRQLSQETESCKVFFAGANFNTEEAELKEVFSEVGKVQEFTLFRMPDNRSRGMGVVLFSTPDEAQRAIADLHQREVDGRTLLVQEDTKRDGKGEGNRRHANDYNMGWDSWNEWDQGPSVKGKDGGKGWKGGKDGKHQDGKSWGKGGHRRGRDAYAYYEDYPEIQDYYGYETDGHTVFFAGASFDTTSGHLRKLFQEAGKIFQFWLFQLPDGRSRGMGIVQYERLDEAQYAIELMHTRVVDGRSIMVKIDDVGALATQGGMDYGGRGSSGKGKDSWGRSGKGGKGYQESIWTNRVFFAGAPFHCTEGNIRSYFAELGTIRSFTVFWLDDGRHRGMGVCTYATNSEAEEALQTGIVIEGRPLFLQEDTSQYVADGPAQQSKGNHQALPYGTSESSSAGRGRGRSNPYDHHYDSYSAGLYNVSVDPNKAVFFANVPFETTETHLRSKFDGVGHVKHLILFMTPDGKSRGMGIVEYTTQAGAIRAYNVLHESNVSGRQMIVDEYRPPHQ